ncbi:hypothetical protein [Halorussus sp. AFM4]
MDWADLFDRAERYGTDVETIRASLAERREGSVDRDASEESEESEETEDA